MKPIRYWHNPNYFLLTRLKQFAALSPFNYKHAAAVLDDRGNVISTGFNIKKTHPKQAKYAKLAKQEGKQFLHAEIAALVKLRSRGTSIVVCRFSSRGLLKSSRPCEVCMLAIKEAGIRTIIYSNEKGELVEEDV